MTRVREIHVSEITGAVADLCSRANSDLPEENLRRIEACLAAEESPLGRVILGKILENHRLAKSEGAPACQDTGVAVVFLEVGQDVHIAGGSLTEAVDEGVRRGYRDAYLRKSVVADPVFERKNTGDNTPAVLHTAIVPGDKLTITVAPKGAGAENMSALAMLKPADGLAGVKDFVVDVVRRAGPNPCPPVVVGVGIGGTFDLVACLAKRALVRPMDSRHPDPRYAALEMELLAEINKLGIGPQGLGGRVTAMDVHIETRPCHIASLPVAVNLHCHIAPHLTMVL